MIQSREIIDILADAAKAMSGESLVFTDYKGMERECECEVGYLFGSAQYFKDYLDEAMKMGRAVKFPLLVLFTPVNETRDDARYYTKAKVRLLLAHGSQKAWNNEQRKRYSFENVLRPLYRRLLEALKADERLDFGYDPVARHDYSENYSYGKYGAYVDRSGEMVSEPIDAIDISNLELKVNKQTCR